MSLFEISEQFCSFFLEGCDAAIIDWFAAVMTMGFALAIFSLILSPLFYLVRGRKK